MKLKEHSITLHGQFVTLRPMTENDWDILLKWNSDPDVLYFSEGGDVKSYNLEQVQDNYRGVSQNALCFIIVFDGQPIGKCWLQRMNIERLLKKYSGKDSRRIDLMIGEKRLWGQGLGTDTIRTLSKFGFEQEGADMIFGLVGGYNLRSIGAFKRAGYEVDAEIEEPPGEKSKFSYDLVIRREQW
ncbi:MAG TPA: GNAT family N-acetyltransferase [Blastocatellia bacterium]|nr:GNAT family N-acetyltransferase [Blastocatellia bacterium]